MSQVTNLAFFPARGRCSSLCADVFILYFPNKKRRICYGSSSYNIGPLAGPEGVAQNVHGGRDDFFGSPVGDAHRDSQNVNLIYVRRCLRDTPRCFGSVIRRKATGV